MLILPFFFFLSLSLSLYGAPPFTFKGRKGQRPFFLLLFLFLFFLSIFLKFSSNTWCMAVPLFYWQRNLRMGIWIPVSLLFFFLLLLWWSSKRVFCVSLPSFFFFVMLLLLFRSFFQPTSFSAMLSHPASARRTYARRWRKKKMHKSRCARQWRSLRFFFFISPSVLTPFHLARRCFPTFLSQSFVYAFVIVIVVFWGMRPRSIPLSNNKQYWQCLCF